MITGAILGTAGAIISKGVSLFENHQKSKIDAQRRSDEIEIAKCNANKDTQVASYQHDSSLGQPSTWVVNVLRLVRPSITAYALILITILWFGANPADKSIIVANALDLSAMAVSWWFGSRK